MWRLAEGAYADNGRALYLAGGLSQPTQQSDLVCRIGQDDTGHMIVQNMTPLPMAMSTCAAVIIGNRLYVACGTLAGGKSTNQLWSLDLKKTTSTMATTSRITRCGPRCLSRPGHLRLEHLSAGRHGRWGQKCP